MKTKPKNQTMKKKMMKEEAQNEEKGIVRLVDTGAKSMMTEVIVKIGAREALVRRGNPKSIIKNLINITMSIEIQRKSIKSEAEVEIETNINDRELILYFSFYRIYKYRIVVVTFFFRCKNIYFYIRSKYLKKKLKYEYNLNNFFLLNSFQFFNIKCIFK